MLCVFAIMVFVGRVILKISVCKLLCKWLVFLDEGYTFQSRRLLCSSHALFINFFLFFDFFTYICV